MRDRRETHSVTPQALTRFMQSMGVAEFLEGNSLFDHMPIEGDHGRAGE